MWPRSSPCRSGPASDHQIPGLGMSGTATDVARRQPNGTWRCIIDNPHGGARELRLPPATLQALGGA